MFVSIYIETYQNDTHIASRLATTGKSLAVLKDPTLQRLHMTSLDIRTFSKDLALGDGDGRLQRSWLKGAGSKPLLKRACNIGRCRCRQKFRSESQMSSAIGKISLKLSSNLSSLVCSWLLFVRPNCWTSHTLKLMTARGAACFLTLGFHIIHRFPFVMGINLMWVNSLTFLRLSSNLHNELLGTKFCEGFVTFL